MRTWDHQITKADEKRCRPIVLKLVEWFESKHIPEIDAVISMTMLLVLLKSQGIEIQNAIEENRELRKRIKELEGKQ